jgi:cytochrome c2
MTKIRRFAAKRGIIPRLGYAPFVTGGSVREGRMKRFMTWALVSVASTAAAIAYAQGDADAGKKYFEEQCIACHTAEPDDGGGAQGPSLIGVFGRIAGSDKEFSYTTQLAASKLTWDAATLERFLSAPDALVPGTSMVIAVPTKGDRDNLIAYFQRTARK